jgi:hypothetical protein
LFVRSQGDFEQVRPILMECQLVRRTGPEGFPGTESIFAKTLKSTLTAEQRASYERNLQELYRSRVEWMVFNIHHNLRLSHDQHQRFVAMIVSETRPLERYGKYDLLALLYVASTLPEDKIKPIFNDSQWRLLRREFDHVQRQEQFLIAEGYLPRKGVAAGARQGPGRMIKKWVPAQD